MNRAEQSGTGIAAPIMDNHIAIQQSIRRIDDVIQQARDLLDRINGENLAPEQNKTTSEEVSLSAVLIATPESIDTKCGILNDLLAAIRDSLF